mmetsp:Transcript_10618/g.25416  ORF Transcript_10618/g.25416 Transcript_10618/m.25416 type:complete len:219 (+) Transcript_10618:441-1097(+)
MNELNNIKKADSLGPRCRAALGVCSFSKARCESCWSGQASCAAQAHRTPAVPNSTKGMSPLATCATWLVTTWLVVTAAARSPPQTICCGRATSHGGERPLDLPLFMINMDDAPTALRIMHARVCPLLAADVCAHRVSAVTPAMAAKAGFASMARDIEEGGCKGGARMAQIEVAISLSHLFGASLARERYPNASAVMFMEPRSGRLREGGLPHLQVPFL